MRGMAQECENFWRAGRQLCGASSLTGHPCILPPHSSDSRRGSGGNDVEALKGSEHNSGIMYTKTDSTGLTRQDKHVQLACKPMLLILKASLFMALGRLQRCQEVLVPPR